MNTRDKFKETLDAARVELPESNSGKGYELLQAARTELRHQAHMLKDSFVGFKKPCETVIYD